MKYKKVLLLFLMSGLLLSGCGKKDTTVPEESTQVEAIVDVPTNEVQTPTPTATPTPTEEVEVVKDSKLEELQLYENENKNLKLFLNELLTLQEQQLYTVYNQLSIGDSHLKVMEALAAAGFRYDEQVCMISCYDDAKNVINMEKRTGLVAFDKMDLTLEEEAKNLTSTETSKNYLKDTSKTEESAEASLDLEEVSTEETTEEVDATKTNPNIPEGAKVLETDKDGNVLIESPEKVEREYQKLDTKNPVYHSYIAFTFNELNVLVGKFKYLDRLEWYPKDLNKDILNGSLTGNVKGIDLKISETADSLTIYEKMDEVRTRIEENELKMDEVKTEYIPQFKEFYDGITEETHEKTVMDSIKEKGYKIEKINKTVLSELNNRFQRNYTEGYYVSLTVDEDAVSPDLRYNDTYMTLLFNDKNNMYYKSLVTEDSIDEQCKDILDINDYELNDIYKNIKELNEDILEIESERSSFTQYIDKNIALFNSKIELSETKDYLIAELEKSGLQYKENFDNSIITSYRDAANLTIPAFKDDGTTNYDECIAVYGGSKDIYLFLKEGITCGVYRTDYFDIAEVTTSTYTNLNTVLIGLNKVDSKLELKKQELIQYTNMLDKRLDSFKSSLGYSINHKEGQIYTKADVVKALELGGYSYDEGMNKGDGLYYIGIRKMPADEDFSLKIYFNSDEEIEIIK